MVDCPDAKMLQYFYGELLGWEQCRLYGCPAVRSSGGIVFLFAQEPDYAPPVWPEEPGQQQKQMHFDFQAESVPEEVRRVRYCPPAWGLFYPRLRGKAGRGLLYAVQRFPL